MFWYRLNEGNGNFGDELNPYLVEKLTGNKVQWAAPYYDSRWNSAKSVALMLLLKRIPLKEILQTSAWDRLVNRKVIFAIGSIIRYADMDVNVWGSGIIDRKEVIYPSKFLAIRGKYTQARIKELGMKAPEVLGDPALLMPLVYQPLLNSRIYNVALIPHYVHYESYKKWCSDSQVLIINLLDPIEKIISEICSCEITLSTSLHGIIVSQAYRIPSLWMKTTTELDKLAGDDIKFADYFSSVNIREYQPVNLNENEPLRDQIYLLKEKFKDVLLPSLSVIEKVQADLLEVAPFPLLPAFKKA